MTKGWKKQPARHALAAKGIRTSVKSSRKKPQILGKWVYDEDEDEKVWVPSVSRRVKWDNMFPEDDDADLSLIIWTAPNGKNYIATEDYYNNTIWGITETRFPVMELSIPEIREYLRAFKFGDPIDRVYSDEPDIDESPASISSAELNGIEDPEEAIKTEKSFREVTDTSFTIVDEDGEFKIHIDEIQNKDELKGSERKTEDML